MHKCKKRRYTALREVFKEARRLRVVRTIRVRCWHLLSWRWKLIRKLRKITNLVTFLARRLTYLTRYEQRVLKAYRKARFYSGSDSCKMLAFRLKHKIWFINHKRNQAQRKMQHLKRRKLHLLVILKRLMLKCSSVCRAAKLLKGKARLLRKSLINARRQYREANACTKRFRGVFKTIQKRRFLLYLWLNKIRRFLQSLYRKRYRKIYLLCHRVKPNDKRCLSINLKLFSKTRHRYKKYE